MCPDFDFCGWWSTWETERPKRGETDMLSSLKNHLLLQSCTYPTNTPPNPHECWESSRPPIFWSFVAPIYDEIGDVMWWLILTLPAPKAVPFLWEDSCHGAMALSFALSEGPLFFRSSCSAPKQQVWAGHEPRTRPLIIEKQHKQLTWWRLN